MDESPGESRSTNADRGAGGGSSGDGLFQTRYREVTISAIIFGLIVGAIMNAAITYAGLKIGFTIVGSAIAAVLGFGVLRGLLRKGTILETNIGQTIASAVNTPNSGVIFTVPVLFLLGYRLSVSDVDFWLITLACVAGAILGGAFIIPLRKQMLDIERLRFPSATGVAVILKSPGAGAAKSLVLVAGIVLSMLIFLPNGLTNIMVRASVDELDRLVDQGKITAEDRERTLAIAGWIENEEAPETVVARGELLKQTKELKDQLAVVEKDLDAVDEEDEAQAATLRAQIETLQTEIETNQNSLDDLKTPLFSDELAMRAFMATHEEAAWRSLRSRQLGWAQKPLPGYADLNLRLRHETDDDGELTIRVDRDRDGKPDLYLQNDRIDLGRFLGLPDQLQLVFAIAPFAIGAGYITGKAGLLVLAGGVLAYFILNPIVFAMGWLPETVRAHEAPDAAFLAFNRPLGIGLLLGGAMMGVIVSLPAIREALKSIVAASKAKAGADELGFKVLIMAVLAALVLLFIAADFVGNKPFNTTDPITEAPIETIDATAQYNGYTIGFESKETAAQWSEWTDDQRDEFMAGKRARPGLFSGLNPHVRALLIAIIGAIWIWFAGIIIAQCTGMTDWSPISGMALLTVVLVLLLAGTGAVVGAVLIGAALCVAITCAADMMADLKTGYLVGSQPKRQQIVELICTGLGPLICMFTLLLIVQVNLQTTGIPIGPGTETVAPQAQALEAVVTGVQGGEMPYALYGFGALLGGLLGLGAFAGLGVLVGLSIYLPFLYISTYGIGCIINMIVTKTKGRRWSEDWGVPFAAGLIVGEAILALCINMLVLARG
ncbi:MAG: hypothetical protein EA376_07055 [Phycisphaeraceae bacterium]|nr:MAG: hypothetical protein EA376_07055 [Phycisphaeraceae bacterium]